MYATRQEMRTALRQRLFDTAGVTFTDAILNDALNRSAQFVTLILAGHSKIHYARGEYTISPSAGTAVHINVTDFHSPISLQSSNGEVFGRQVDEREFTRTVFKTPTDGEFRFCVTYDPALERHYIKAAFSGGLEPVGECILVYNRRITILDPTASSGTGDDAKTYPTVPYAYLDWIVAHAAAVLATQAMLSNAPALLGYWTSLQDTFLIDSRASTSPLSTR